MVGNVLGAAVFVAFSATVIGRRWSLSVAEERLTAWRKETLFGAFLAALAAAGVIAVPDAPGGTMLAGTVSLAFFVGLVTAISAWQVDEFVKRRGVLTLRRALPKAVREWNRAARISAAELWRNLTSHNWSEVRPGRFTTRRLEGLRGFISLYMVLFVTLIVMVMLGTTTSVLMNSDPASAFLAAAASFNAVLIAAHAVLAALLLVVIVVLARLTNMLQVPLSPGHALRGAAEAVGWGTAAGALFGALTPLLITFEPLAMFFGAGPGGEAVYEPSIIVELSAIGAVGGLLVGAAMMPSLLLSSAENLLVRRVIGPGLYSVIILGTSLGLVPIGQTGRQLLDMNRPLLGIDGSRCGETVPGGIDLARQSVAIELVERCNGEWILPDSWVAGSMLPLAIGIAVVLIVNDVRQKPAAAAVEGE
jgi:hypothetical protein